MRVSGITIPSDKRLVVSLQYIYGVGSARAKVVCKKAKMDESVRIKDLTPEQEEVLRAVLTKYVLESDLRRKVSQSVRQLQEIGSYRGYRHRRKLPVRGQHTKTNARTKRGKKTVIANKKKVTK